MLYIASLYSAGLAHTTIKSAMSALNYVNRLQGGPDMSSDFWLQKMSVGITKLSPSQDSRMPITEFILERLLQILPCVASSQYVTHLFSAMFVLAFRAFLRVGEMTVSSTSVPNQNLLQLSDISIDSGKRVVHVTFRHYKHKVGTESLVISLPHSPPPLELTRILSVYLGHRGYQSGPLFIYNNKPVTQRFFSSLLQQVLSAAGFESSNIKSHSFRIGAATLCFSKGYTSDQIQRMGRWKSDAFRKYIRIPSFVV